LSSQIRSPGAQVSLSGNQMCAAEAEFVFEFNACLPPRSTQYSRMEVLQAVGALRLGIEIPDSRLNGFAGAGAPQLVADNACAHVFVLGQAVASGWRQDNLAAQRVALCVDGDEVAVGYGADALGDPRDALVWFVNHLSSRGKAIESGQFVTTGVCAGPVAVKPGQSVIARFDGYGEVDLRLTAED
jgi:2-keto-4-pentenoate hydratase